MTHGDLTELECGFEVWLKLGLLIRYNWFPRGYYHQVALDSNIHSDEYQYRYVFITRYSVKRILYWNKYLYKY